MKSVNGYTVGECYICIINTRSNLTIGKSYKVTDVYSYDKNSAMLTIVNDEGDEVDYVSDRFMSLSEARQHKINDILK